MFQIQRIYDISEPTKRAVRGLERKGGVSEANRTERKKSVQGMEMHQSRKGTERRRGWGKERNVVRVGIALDKERAG